MDLVEEEDAPARVDVEGRRSDRPEVPPLLEPGLSGPSPQLANATRAPSRLLRPEPVCPSSTVTLSRSGRETCGAVGSTCGERDRARPTAGASSSA